MSIETKFVEALSNLQKRIPLDPGGTTQNTNNPSCSVVPLGLNEIGISSPSDKSLGYYLSSLRDYYPLP